MLIIFFVALDAPIVPNFQLCYLPGMRITIVHYIAAINSLQLGIIIVLYAATVKIIADMLIAKQEE
jgi:hypothetical protein